MCCTSKKKVLPPTDNNKGNINQQPLPFAPPTPNPIASKTEEKSSLFNSGIPKSRLNFGANEFEAKPFVDQKNFVQTIKVPTKEQDLGDRLQNYAVEMNQMNQSQLLMPKQILNYDLDHQGGVTQIPVLNTFHYETQLKHLFVDKQVLQNGNYSRIMDKATKQMYESNRNNQSGIHRTNNAEQGSNDNKLIKRTDSIQE